MVKVLRSYMLCVILSYYIGIYVAELFWFLCHSFAKTVDKTANNELERERTGKKRKCCIFRGWGKAGSDGVYRRKLVPFRGTPPPFSAADGNLLYQCSRPTGSHEASANMALNLSLYNWALRIRTTDPSLFLGPSPETGKVMKRIAAKIF